MNTKDAPDTDVAAFRREAERLFRDEILDRWACARNVWRTAWALDTLLDYFRICGVDTSSLAGDALHALNPTHLGNWWDDFGWIGIAALRAAEQNAFPAQGDAFVKIAINAWAYMYGPGWSKSRSTVYPFQEASLPGWAEFAQKHQLPNGISTNVGAPNVWKMIDRTFPGVTPDQKYRQQPRYSPGGVWNSAIADAWQPVPSPVYVGDIGNSGALSPRQNTVTNGLYAILTLRIYRASKNPSYRRVFSASGLDAGACFQAWKDQVVWFNRWMVETKDPCQSLKIIPTSDIAKCLVRERVSTYLDSRSGKIHWDPSYGSELIWTGDQGLLLGALREGKAMALPLPVFAYYPGILASVFDNGFAPRRYGQTGNIQGEFLLPWIALEQRQPGGDPYASTPPGSDDGDYQTGVGVFMRYLLQAYESDPLLVQKYKSVVLDSACKIIQPGFGENAHPVGACDAFTAYSTADLDELTAYINRLSTLLLAIRMSR